MANSSLESSGQHIEKSAENSRGSAEAASSAYSRDAAADLKWATGPSSADQHLNKATISEDAIHFGAAEVGAAGKPKPGEFNKTPPNYDNGVGPAPNEVHKTPPNYDNGVGPAPSEFHKTPPNYDNGVGPAPSEFHKTPPNYDNGVGPAPSDLHKTAPNYDGGEHPASNDFHKTPPSYDNVNQDPSARSALESKTRSDGPKDAQTSEEDGSIGEAIRGDSSGQPAIHDTKRKS